MSVSAAQVAAIEDSTPANEPAGGRPLPRKLRAEVLRACMDAGIATTHGHAWRLYKQWREKRAREAREVTIEEFRLHAQRRGDLMQVRGKRNREWRTHT